ncbi:preprotein translocase subunit SecY [Caproiciproducens sp. MSJ-32]|uniref:preprotein translocase subunit SecY n=1 Tax=Caproiciproducens sp. MSJ-32 TaxID=2841527 RepID=UPI001C107804|nr:preprotein translocase subunit SecY [Caproiciproducens sp. MSJ-32]MBU5455733.1 preprotein translocase subunit SecY [Caproiciproducens sp. MSJ-32]
MLSTLRNAWKVPELKKKFLWTILLIAIFRIGTHIPVPGISKEVLESLAQSGTLFGFYDLISGGAFSQFSILALGVTPYINASIIVQLLTIAVPSLEQLSKEGQEGRKKIQNITRILSIFIGFILAFGTYNLAASRGATQDGGFSQIIVVLISLVAGSTFSMWLGDQITAKGFGNGTSILIFVNIVSQLPVTLMSLYTLKSIGKITIVEILLFVLFMLIMLVASVFFSLAERRIPVQYAGKAVGNKVMRAQNTHIPISIIGSAVIAIIFSSSVMMFPATLAQFFPNSKVLASLTTSKYSLFNRGTWLYAVVYSLLTIFFTWFYTQITMKPDEMAENLHKSAGFVPGIRPGNATEKYFEKLLTKVSIIGGLFAAVLAVLPILMSNTNLQGIQFGGTSLLIMVGVGLDFSRQLDSQLIMRHYQGFLK